MMNQKKLTILVSAIVLILLGVGAAGATIPQQTAQPAAPAAAIADSITYQGRLEGPGGGTADGAYTMRFILYDADVGGTAVWDSGNLNVTVDNGLFNVQLDVDQTDFNGEALWLSLIVEGETLSPRQEITPAPYALSLRPGADIVGDALGAADAILAGYAPATGTALYADANGGVGLFGDSENSYGVWGSSNDSWGGYFTSDGGYGIRVDTAGAAHYDHGAYITANGGYGVYAVSDNNQALRGEAGDMSDIATAFGRVGVVGLGENRGVHGASNNGLGVYGTSTNGTGVFGNTSRPDRNYGLYTNDNLFSLNINMSGAIMQVMQNNGADPLSPGDVVVFTGIDPAAAAVDGPLVQVSKIETANSTAVAGVVYSRFDVEALPTDESVAEGFSADVSVTPPGSAAPGEYVLVVVQGPAQVRVSAAAGGDIEAGDLLATSSAAGLAGKVQTINMGGVETAVPGTVLGKALEPLASSEDGMIFVYVTLQ